MRRPKMIFFDMDGCLIDSESVYIHAWGRVFKENDIPISYAQILTWQGLVWDKIEEQITAITHDKERTKHLRQIREAYFFASLNNNEVSLKPYAAEFLELLKEKIYPWCWFPQPIKRKH